MTATQTQDNLTNQERRTMASRQRILDAAVACLVEQGYSGASTLQIQERAGVSRGRLLHHFPSRDDLLVAAAEHLAAQRVTALRGESAEAITARDGSAARINQAVEQMWLTFHQPYFWAAIELWVAARSNVYLRESLGPVERQLYVDIQQTLKTMFGPAHSAHSRFRLVTDLLVSSMRGVAVTYGFNDRPAATDPHVAQWKELARTLLVER